MFRKGSSDMIAAIIIILVIFALAAFFVCSIPNSEEPDTERTLGFQPNTPMALVASSQKVMIVNYAMMKPWFESVGQKVKIVSITGIGMGGYGRDTYFLIVFEDVVPSKTNVESEKGIH